VNVAIRVNSLYRTAARHIQTFVLWITERGNWLSVRVADTPEYELETQRERPSMNSVEWFNDQIRWAAENPTLPKAAKKVPLTSHMTYSVNLCITPQVFNCGANSLQLGAMLGLYY